MAQLVRTTNDLIVNSMILLGELGVGEQADAFMLTTGLEITNALLDFFNADSIYIPFVTDINFTMVVGQADYTISNMVVANVTANRIVDLVYANYTVQPAGSEPIIYPIKIISKAEFLNVVRVQNLNARPGFVVLNKQADESIVTFYPEPDQPYPCTLRAKVMIDSVAAYDDLSQLPPFYYEFLKYALARKLKAYYPSGNWPPENEEDYQNMYNTLKNANETDLTIRPSAIMVAPQPFYWPNILAY